MCTSKSLYSANGVQGPDNMRQIDPGWTRIPGWLFSIDPCLYGKNKKQKRQIRMLEMTQHVVNTPRLRLHEKSWPSSARLTKTTCFAKTPRVITNWFWLAFLQKANQMQLSILAKPRSTRLMLYRKDIGTIFLGYFIPFLRETWSRQLLLSLRVCSPLFDKDLDN